MGYAQEALLRELRSIREQLVALTEATRVDHAKPKVMLMNFKGDISAQQFHEFAERFNQFMRESFPEEGVEDGTQEP